MPDVLRHALFVEPEGEALDLITGWKRRVGARWPDARYLSHPPHGTIWVGELREPDAAGRALANAIRDAQRAPIELSSPHVFYDDVMAGGGQTIAFAAARRESLAKLQRVVCEALEPYVIEGYRFAGGKWMPHFSVASLPIRRNDPVIAEFLATPLAGMVTPCIISWWQVAGDRHDRLAWL